MMRKNYARHASETAGRISLPEKKKRTAKPLLPQREQRFSEQHRLGIDVPVYTSLFCRMSAFAADALNSLPEILDTVLPLDRKKRGMLPDAIRDLSRMLTSERSEINRSYWSSPRLLAAYLHYFLPWNLVRLVQLLPKRDLPLCKDNATDLSILDLGSGPLTMPIALWLAREDWRSQPLTLVCSDTAPHPLEIGRQLLEMLAEKAGMPLLWKIHLVREPVNKALAQMQNVQLIMAGNVLNELRDKTGKILLERMADLVFAVEKILAPDGRVLFVEPGTRLGGTLIASLRETALEENLIPIAPCTHREACPLTGQRMRGWCHVVMDACGPSWLARLAKDAGLPKTVLNLSFMLLRRDKTLSPDANLADHIPARILSDAFPVPGLGYARYACTGAGLAIIPHARSLPSGAFCQCTRTNPSQHDAKSGAVVMHCEQKSKQQ